MYSVFSHYFSSYSTLFLGSPIKHLGRVCCVQFFCVSSLFVFGLSFPCSVFKLTCIFFSSVFILIQGIFFRGESSDLAFKRIILASVLRLNFRATIPLMEIFLYLLTARWACFPVLLHFSGVSRGELYTMMSLHFVTKSLKAWSMVSMGPWLKTEN